MFTKHETGKFYCVYDLNTSSAPPRVQLEIYQTGMGMVEKRAFSWGQVIGEEKIPLLGSKPAPTVREPK